MATGQQCAPPNRCNGGGARDAVRLVRVGRLPGYAGQVPSSGKSRFWQTQKSVGLGGGEPVVLGAQPGDLELERPYLCTQLGNLVKQAPIGRAAHVAEEGLGHIVSL
jgi:hypothetical protein